MSRYRAKCCRKTSRPSTSASRVFVMPSSCCSPLRYSSSALCTASINRAGQRIVGTALVIDAALQRTVRADQAVQRFQDVAIDHTRNLHGGLEDVEGEEGEQRFVVAQQLLGDLDVAVGKFGGRSCANVFSCLRPSRRNSQSSGQSTVTSRSVPQQRSRYRRAHPDRNGADGGSDKLRTPFP